MSPLPHPELDENRLRELQEDLQGQRQRLQRQVDRARDRGAITLDQTSIGRLSRMDALMNQGLGQASETRTLEELGLVHDALARLEGGTYGICHTCGRPIPYARLVVMPEARECAGCRR